MALPGSGPISSSMIQTEFGSTNPIAISEYYKGGEYVPNTATNVNIPTSGQIKFSDFYNGSSLVSFEYSLQVLTVDDVCNGGDNIQVFQAVSPFNFDSNIYTDSSLTIFSNAGYYLLFGDFFNSQRQWSGTSWLGGASICP